MTCFEIIKEVLDEIYSSLPLENRDILIINQLKNLETAYRKLFIGCIVDYSDPATRFAYVFRYVTSHANMVFKIIESSTVLSSLFSNKEIATTCVGGGPGSDLLGMMKYLNENNLHPKLKCYLLDGEPLWLDTWDDVDSKVGQDFKLTKTAMPFDIFSESSWKNLTKYLNADIFTFVYFVSEVFSNKKKAESFFDHIFSKAKRGAYILYIDNDVSDFYSWFDEIVNKKHSYKIISSDRFLIRMPLQEEKMVLNEYITKFGNPKLSGQIAFRIYQKP